VQAIAEERQYNDAAQSGVGARAGLTAYRPRKLRGTHPLVLQRHPPGDVERTLGFGL